MTQPNKDRLIRAIKWWLISLATKYGRNLTLTIDGRVISTRRGFDWHKQRIYLGGDADFSKFADGGYMSQEAFNDMVATNPEATDE